MKKMQRIIMQNLPGFAKGPIVRNKINIPDIPATDFIFKIATEEDELEQAYGLLYHAYRKKGFIDKDDCKKHFSVYHAHPLSVTFVGKYGDEVAITVSLLIDSELGLPMDSLYKKELDVLRKQKRIIAEVGTLASAPRFRKGNQILPMMMNNILHRYAKKHLHLDDLVITVNPLHEFIYRHAILFKRFGKNKPYDSVNGHIAVPMRLNIHKVEKEHFKVYHRKPDNKNLYQFFFTTFYSNIRLPQDRQLLSTFDRQRYELFFKQFTDKDNEVLDSQKEELFRLYSELENINDKLDRTMALSSEVCKTLLQK